MDDIPIVKLGLILLVACVVAMLARRVKLPYSVDLVIAGIGLALVGPTVELVLIPDLIFTILPPPLIFEAALQLKWRPFVRDLPVTLTLAFPGVVLIGPRINSGLGRGRRRQRATGRGERRAPAQVRDTRNAAFETTLRPVLNRILGLGHRLIKPDPDSG